MSISQAHLESLTHMFRAFAPLEADRWCYLLTLAPSKWAKITPIKIWPGPNPFESVPNIPLSELLTSPTLEQYWNNDVVVLRCGHSQNPGVSSLSLHNVFPQGNWEYDIVFEGFVSIVPGKLALGLNHEGGICVFNA